MDKKQFVYKTWPKAIIEKLRCTKAELAEWMGLNRINFDFALPQEWLERFVAENALDYEFVLSTTFYAYPTAPIKAGIVSACREIDDLIGKEASGFPEIMEGWKRVDEDGVPADLLEETQETASRFIERGLKHLYDKTGGMVYNIEIAWHDDKPHVVALL